MAEPYEGSNEPGISPTGAVVVTVVALVVSVGSAIGVCMLGLFLGMIFGFLPLWEDGTSYPHQDAWTTGTLVVALLTACVPFVAVERGGRRP